MIGSILGAIAVAAGADGVQGLKNNLHPEMLETWEKAGCHQVFHALPFYTLAWAITHWTA